MRWRGLHEPLRHGMRKFFHLLPGVPANERNDDMEPFPACRFDLASKAKLKQKHLQSLGDLHQ